MKEIQITDPHRRKHFNFFRQMDQPHFNICANVDITNLLAWLEEEELPFSPTIVYCLSLIANRIPPFRYRIRGEKIVEHEQVHPSYSINTEVSDVFSFCQVDFVKDYDTFIKRARQKESELQRNPSFEDEAGRDDFLFMSALPWITFTSVSHAMHYSPVDSVPRFTWGKYHKEKRCVLMPLSVQAHHAVVDGRHMGQFFNDLQDLLGDPGQIQR